MRYRVIRFFAVGAASVALRNSIIIFAGLVLSLVFVVVPDLPLFIRVQVLGRVGGLPVSPADRPSQGDRVVRLPDVGWCGWRARDPRVVGSANRNGWFDHGPAGLAGNRGKSRPWADLGPGRGAGRGSPASCG